MEISMDHLEQKLIEQQAQVKSPVFAAILGFFFPATSARYNRRLGVAAAFLCLDVVFFLLTLVGIGFALLFLFRLFAAYFGWKWSFEINREGLANLIRERPRAAGE
jgi:predicted membrane protein